MQTVDFTAMKDGTQADYALLLELEKPHTAATSQRILRELRLQGEETLPGYKISRLDHGLQAATRADREGADIDWVVATLIHDIGDGLAPQNHDKMAAEIIRPFVREEVTWVIAHHGVFQMVYYAHHYGWDRYQRERYAAHPCYQSCVDFCERWDQSSFDPGYDTLPLTAFEPMVHEVFARKAYDENVVKTGVVEGLG